MTILVMHHKHPTFQVTGRGTKVNRDDYHEVAVVETNDLDVAYKLTNTIEEPWINNEGVVFLDSPDHGKTGCRSTAVGDLLIVVTKSETHAGAPSRATQVKIWRVVEVGFQSVTWS
jgi:hypothetical protein